MKKRQVIVGARISVIALASILLINEVRATSYLAQAGPPPLRFQTLHPFNLLLLNPLQIKPATTNASPANSFITPSIPLRPLAEMTPPDNSTSSDSTENDNLDFTGSLLPDQFIQTTNAPATSSANDLLVITPQMLVNYFKPSRGSTNNAAASVIAPVSFIPPVTSKQSSSASYKTP